MAWRVTEDGVPYRNRVPTDDYFCELLHSQDTFDTAILLQATILYNSSSGDVATLEKYTVPPIVRKRAGQLAERPEFLKQFISRPFKIGDAVRWFFISNHLPTLLPLVELGALTVLLKVLQDDDEYYRTTAMLALLNFVRNPATHPFLTPQHCLQLRNIFFEFKYSKIRAEIISSIIDNMPALFHPSFLVSLLNSRTSSPCVLETLAANSSLSKLITSDNVATLFKDLSNIHRGPAAIHILAGYQKATHFSSAPQIKIILEHLLFGTEDIVEGAVQFLHEVPEDHHVAIMEGLQMLVVPVLPDRNVIAVQRAIKCRRIHQLLADVVASTLINNLDNSSLALSIVDILQSLQATNTCLPQITTTNIKPLLRQLITSNNLKQMTTIVHRLRNFDVIGGLLLDKKVVEALLTVMNKQAIELLCMIPDTTSLVANAVLNRLASSKFSPNILDFFEFLGSSEANHSRVTTAGIMPLLQQLISNNHLDHMTSIVFSLRMHKMVIELLADAQVFHSLLLVMNSQAQKLMCMVPDRTWVCAALVKAGIVPTRLLKELQDSLLIYLTIPPIARDKNAPWFIESAVLMPFKDMNKTYITLPAQHRDLKFVTEFYLRCPVPGFDIKSVSLVHCEQLFNLFTARIETLQARKGKVAFMPRWKSDNRLSEIEVDHRNAVMKRFASLTHKYDMAPEVSFVLGWHGTSKSALDSLFSTGFANLASTDAGFFGKGLYTSPDAEYAFRVYSSGALLLNWIATFSPFPVIARDEPELAEKGNYQNYDSHFVPVYSPNHPNTKVYHACEPHQQPQYFELVVFESSQMLPHYIVELQPTFPQEIAPAKDVAETNETAKDAKSVTRVF